MDSVDGCGRWRCARTHQRHLGENGKEDGMEMRAELTSGEVRFENDGCVPHAYLPVDGKISAVS